MLKGETKFDRLMNALERNSRAVESLVATHSRPVPYPLPRVPQPPLSCVRCLKGGPSIVCGRKSFRHRCKYCIQLHTKCINVRILIAFAPHLLISRSFRGSSLAKVLCFILHACRAEFLDTQITGTAFMMQRTLGGVPLSGAPTSEPERAAAGLEGLAIHGGIITDTMGLGKIFLVLLFLNYTAVHQRRTQHKPCLVLVPEGVVLSQWLQAIYRNFPDLALNSRPWREADRRKVCEQLGDYPWYEAGVGGSPVLVNLRFWSSNLQYIFDKNNPIASRAI